MLSRKYEYMKHHKKTKVGEKNQDSRILIWNLFCPWFLDLGSLAELRAQHDRIVDLAAQPAAGCWTAVCFRLLEGKLCHVPLLSDPSYPDNSYQKVIDSALFFFF